MAAIQVQSEGGEGGGMDESNAAHRQKKVRDPENMVLGRVALPQMDLKIRFLS